MKPSLWWRIRHRLRGGNLAVLRKWDAERRAEAFKEAGFLTSDPNVIASLSDKELAMLQSKHTEGSRQFILAEYEWQRRLNAQQINGIYRASWIGLLGVLLGYGLTKLDVLIDLFIK